MLYHVRWGKCYGMLANIIEPSAAKRFSVHELHGQLIQPMVMTVPRESDTAHVCMTKSIDPRASLSDVCGERI